MTEAVGGNKGTATRMVCPACGVEMNFHAEKINQSARAVGESEFAAQGDECGEVVEEIHTCPGCGKIGSRRAV